LLYASHDNHVLQPFLDQAKQDASKKVLLVIAYRLVKFAPNPFLCADWYSREEKEEAIKILKAHGMAQFCRLSQRCKKETLEAIRQAWKEKPS
jgi:hypothetical protein